MSHSMSEPITGNGNQPSDSPGVVETPRRRSPLPIALIAVLFVLVSFLTWYGTWFGRKLTDQEIEKYLADVQKPRHVQHALFQIEERIENEDQSVKRWYPQVLALAGHPETEYRLVAAWVMGADNTSADFHAALLRLVEDPEPMVRRNAALALVRFGDAHGRKELLEMLRPFAVVAPAEGVLSSTLDEGQQVARGSLLARIRRGEQTLEVRSPLSGKISDVVAREGAQVVAGEVILMIGPNSSNVWEALRGLSLVGGREDLPDVERYAQGVEAMPERVKEQAALTVKAIQSRSEKNQ